MHISKSDKDRDLLDEKGPMFTRGFMTKGELLKFLVGQTPNQREIHAVHINVQELRIMKRGKKSRNAYCLVAGQVGLSGRDVSRGHTSSFLSHSLIRRTHFDIIFWPRRQAQLAAKLKPNHF